MIQFKKPKFWDLKKPNSISIALKPISIIIKNLVKIKYLVSSRKTYPNIKLICVGNIYLGGTGKTSLCLKLYELLSKKYKCCFIKKYYKNQKDEQMLLENKGKLYCNKKRSTAIISAINDKYDIAILDDGLQDSEIKFDKEIICFNGKNWIGNGLTIPSGPLREEFRLLSKYKNICINGDLENKDLILKELNNLSKSFKIFTSEYYPTNINEFEKKKNYLAFSGIGNHKSFISMLKKYDLKIIKEIEFPDHYQFSPNDIKKILNTAEDENLEIITTEKDYLRLNNIDNKKINYVKSELKLDNENEFIKIILEDVNQI